MGQTLAQRFFSLRQVASPLGSVAEGTRSSPALPRGRWPWDLKGCDWCQQAEYRFFQVWFFSPSMCVEKVTEKSRITNNEMFKLFAIKQTKCSYL